MLIEYYWELITILVLRVARRCTFSERQLDPCTLDKQFTAFSIQTVGEVCFEPAVQKTCKVPEVFMVTRCLNIELVYDFK